jgi:hypothetical protein
MRQGNPPQWLKEESRVFEKLQSGIYNIKTNGHGKKG